MKNAFTMIELIFVIVILGILAAVAIPKLSATRNDAVVSKLANNIMTGASEIASYAMSQAETDENLSVMSNSIKNMQESGEATLTDNEAKIKVGNVDDCIIVKIESNTTTDTLNINFSDANGDNLCLALQGAINADEYPMKLRGVNVTY